jgi:hypothetical protein
VRPLFWPLGLCLALCAQEKPAEVLERRPMISSVFPLSGRPGRTVEFTVRGEFLDGAKRVEFESPDVTGSVLNSTYTTAKVKVSIAANAEPGPRYFRLFSPRGATNLMLYRLTKLPETVEIPGNGELDHATPVTVPSLISGALHADMGGMAAWGEEADLYRFHAKRGQRIQFNLFGVRSLGGRPGLPQFNADLSLTLLRADGRQLIWDEGRFVWDPYLDYTFPEDGDYIASVTVTRAPTTVVFVFPRFEPAFYLLSIGAAPQIWNVYPAGAQRGREVELEVRADFMPAKPKLILNSRGLEATIRRTPEPGIFKMKVRSSPDASLGLHHISVQDESGTSAPVRFAIGELPEQMEVEPNDSREQAQALAWPVTVNGRMDHRADHDWYRIEVKPGQKLAFEVEAESIGGSRMDANVTLVDAKGKDLKFVDDGPKAGLAAVRDPKFTYSFTEGGVYYLNVASTLREFGPDQIYRMTIREADADFNLSLAGAYLPKYEPRDRFSVPQGGRNSIFVVVGRQDDFDGEVQLEVKGLPQGVTAAPVTVGGKQASGKIVLLAAPDARLADSTIEIIGRAKIGNREVVRTALLPAMVRGGGPGFWDYRPTKLYVTVIPPVHFSLDPVAEVIFLVRGQSADFGVKLARRAGFTAPVKVTLQNVPPGVTLEETEVMDEGRQIRLRLKAAESAAKTRLSDLIVVGEAKVGGKTVFESSPKMTLQLD